MRTTDVDLSPKDISALTSPDALAAFLARLDYKTDSRTPLTPQALGLTGETANAIKKVELLAKDEDDELLVVFAQPRSLTAKVRNDAVRALGRRIEYYLLILASDFESIEFVLVDKQKRDKPGPASTAQIQVVPKVICVDRRDPGRSLQALRRFTWTCQYGLDQFDKLRSTFDYAAYAGKYFHNRALFSDHYLEDQYCLKANPAWGESPASMFLGTQELLKDGPQRWQNQGKQVVLQQLFEPIFRQLGFQVVAYRNGKPDHQTDPDYLFKDSDGETLTAAFVYPWNRWLDGPDVHDADNPEENPGACVVTALDAGMANWIVVTNGRLWRLYSRHAHARATNYYEVDLIEALAASGETDPNEAFRYWWLFFRPDAFRVRSGESRCWLDGILHGSRDYAKRLGDRLKERIFFTIFPHLAKGFLVDAEGRLAHSSPHTLEELGEVFEATLTLLYRLLFLLYAESRDLLPIRETSYGNASLKKLKEEIAEKAGTILDEAKGRLEKTYSPKETGLYDRLAKLFEAVDKGDPVLNVPTYNGGLFSTTPDDSDVREQKIARFLKTHKIPDRFLAEAIDRLGRDQDEKTLALVFIDYKSLEVRHLGSIYEGLLEFKLKVASEDLTTQADKGAERYIPLSQAKGKKGKTTKVEVSKGEVYLSNDKADRKASGSYYTPDPIVEYIVTQAVGPVLDEKLEALRPEFRKVRKTYDRHLGNAKYPGSGVNVKDPSALREFAARETYNSHRDLVDRLFDLKVLDPAMGSGHFLVEAVDFVTDRLLTFLNAFPINPVGFALERTRNSILESLGKQGVSVDPAKLTDINLLKRHVLKRCIYGVDLNPMAVELAKVSLWLDAFTLGAPLSFLDHHLRPGNSLVGATIKELRSETSGLLGLDYFPLLQAIQRFLEISRSADATADEVANSVKLHKEARRRLSGYKIVLDLLVAEHFGFPKAAALVREGSDLNFSDLEQFTESLHDDDERFLVAQVQDLARRPDRLFFHWEIEFPEVFFGFVEHSNQQIKHKDQLAAGSAGFDAIVGNPPYVRQQWVKSLNNYLKRTFQTFDSAGDLYVYFQEIEIQNLRANGRMGMIVANKWMRSGYGEALRGYLRRTTQPLEVIDFGHSPIFPDADTFPCILLVIKRFTPLAAKAQTPEDEELVACEVPRDRWSDSMDLIAYANTNHHLIPTKLLRDEGWSLEPTQVQLLLERIRVKGQPLGDYVGRPPLMGIKTGLNEAFIIDGSTRDRLVEEDAKSESIFRPLLRGRDAARWNNRDSSYFLITLTSSENAEWPWSEAKSKAEEIFRRTYPAIFSHLLPFREDLIKRQDQGRFYWELRSCDYMQEFDKPKIAYQDLAWFSEFAQEESGSVANNTVYFIPTRDSVLLAVLNSPLLWWYMWRKAQHGKDEVLRLFTDFVVTLPIPSLSGEMRATTERLTEQIIGIEKKTQEFEAEFTESIRAALSIEVPSEKLVSWLPLSTEDFAKRLFKSAGAKQPSSKLIEDIHVFHQTRRTRQIELLGQQLSIERQLAGLVEDAYGLTLEDKVLLRSTRPVRDPLTTLEAKIRGGESFEPSEEAS